MPLIIPEQINPENGGVRVGEDWFNLSKPRGNNPGYQGPRLELGVQYEVEVDYWTPPGTTKEVRFINRAKPAGEAITAAPSPYEAAPRAAQQRVTATAQRDATGRSIERQVALKAAVELWNGVEGWSADEVKATAATFDDWLKDQSVPPPLAEQAMDAGVVVPVEEQQQEPQRYSGDPGPGQ